MRKILSSNKYLVVYNKHNISNRLLDATGGDMFVAFNHFTQRYEIHSNYSFKRNRESLQAAFEDKNLLNGWLLRDIKANDFRRFVDEIKTDRERLEYLHDKEDDRRFDEFSKKSMKNVVEAYLGRSF